MKAQQNLLREVIQDIRQTEANTADIVSDIKPFIPTVVTSLYEPKLVLVLEQQLKKTNEFIRDKRVQALISKQFNNKEYTLFDPSNGDNMCESRIFLLDIFKQSRRYDELSGDERLIISICQILRLYQISVFDEFGLEVKSIEKPSIISYQLDNQGSKITISKCTVKKSPYDTVSMISHALSFISARYVQKLAFMVDPEILPDLVIYNRDKNFAGKVLKFPSQLKACPTAFTIFHSLKMLEVPMIYKITRLEAEGQSLKLQGVGFIAVRFIEDQLRCIDLESLDPDEPQMIFNAKSVFSDMGRKTSDNSILSRIAKICEIEEFGEYINALREEFNSGIEAIQNIMTAFALLDSIQIDSKHRQGGYTSTILNRTKKILLFETDNIFDMQKQKLGGERSFESVPIQLCHCYINSLANERRDAAELMERSPKATERIEKQFFKNMSGTIVAL